MILALLAGEFCNFEEDLNSRLVRWGMSVWWVVENSAVVGVMPQPSERLKL